MGCIKRCASRWLAVSLIVFAGLLAMPARAFAAPEHWLTDIYGNNLSGATVDVSVLEQGIILNDIWVLGDRHGGGWFRLIVTDLDTGTTLPYVGYQNLGMTPIGDEKDPISDAYITNLCQCIVIYSGFVPGHSYQITLRFRENPTATDEYDYITFGSGGSQDDGADDDADDDTDDKTDDDADDDPDSSQPSTDGDDSGGTGGDDSGSGQSKVDNPGIEDSPATDAGNANAENASAPDGGTLNADANAESGLSTRDSDSVGDFSLSTDALPDSSDNDNAESTKSSTFGTVPALDGASLLSLGQVYQISSSDSKGAEGGADAVSGSPVAVEVTGIPWLWMLLWLVVALAWPAGIAARALRYRCAVRRASRLRAQ